MVDNDYSIKYSVIISHEVSCNAKSDFRISPNPVNQSQGVLNISITRTTQDQVLVLSDINGKRIKTILVNASLDANNLDIDVSKLPEGIYILSMQSSDRVVSKRFVIQN